MIDDEILVFRRLLRINTHYVKTVRRIFMIFSIDILYRNLSSKHEFRENRRSES